MEGNVVIDVLLKHYLTNDLSRPLEKSREEAFVKVYNMVEDGKEIRDALDDLHYEVSKAAFYNGFAAAMELMKVSHS